MRFSYSILLLVFSVIVVSEVTGVYFLYEFKNSLQDQIVSDSEKIDAMMVNRIDSYSIERIIDLTNLAKSSTFESAIQASDAELGGMPDRAQYVNNMSQGWEAAPSNETTPFMRTLIDSKPSGQLRQIQYFENLLLGTKVYDDIFMTNAYGTNVIEMGKTADYTHYGEDWWKGAKNDGIYIGGLRFDNSSRTSSYTIAIQLNDENGNTIGVAKSVISTQPIIKIIKNQLNSTTPTPLEYELLAAGGLVIYSSDPTEKPGSLNHELEYSGNLTGTSGHFVQTINGEDYLVTYSHSTNSKFSPLFDWVFVTKYRLTQVMGPVYELSYLLITIVIVLLVTVSAIVFMISEKLARPIEQVRQGLRSFNKGTMVKIEPHGEEEVRDLIGQYNRMIERRQNQRSESPEP